MELARSFVIRCHTQSVDAIHARMALFGAALAA
jgi:hypothetical protein